MKNLTIRLVLVLTLLGGKVSAMSVNQHPADSTQYLLLNMALQLQITDAVDNMYNFKFHQAEVEFNWIKYNYPEHPLAYFLYGISTWWQMMPNLDKESPLGDEFLAYMDTTITKAEVMFKQDETNIEAAFFLAGAYGFQGRYHSEKKNWMRAAGADQRVRNSLQNRPGAHCDQPRLRVWGD